MTPFFRFILTLLAVGVAVNLAIVVAANARSVAQQETNRQAELAAFKHLLDVVNDSGRRAYIAVESQEVTGDGKVTRTTLLVRRQFQSSLNPANAPLDDRLPINRIVINTDKLYLDALIVEFGPNFKIDVDGHDILRGRRLSFFAHVYGEGETVTDDADPPFSFVHAPDVPELIRIYPGQESPTFMENQLWSHIWDLMQNPLWAKNADLQGHYLDPAIITVHNGHAYEAYLNTTSVSLREDTTPGRATKIFEDWRKQNLKQIP